MNAYKALAVSYDRLTNDVDYRAVVDFYQQIIDREGLRPRTVVDLACGTGSVSAILAEKGLTVTGVDMVRPGDEMRIKVSDGTIVATATGYEE